VTNQQLLTLALSGFTLAVLRGIWSYFIEWRDKRALLPAGVRNAGFWTDRKVYVAERAMVWAWWAFVAFGVFSVAFVALWLAVM
jgi:hypothetical protein